MIVGHGSFWVRERVFGEDGENCMVDGEDAFGLRSEPLMVEDDKKWLVKQCIFLFLFS